MSKVLMIYGLYEPTVIMTECFYKTVMPRYGVTTRFVLASQVKASDIEWSDIVISIRSQSYLELGIARIAKKAGRLYGAEYDDDFLALENYSNRRVIQMKAMLSILKETNFLIVTNDKLGKKLGALAGHQNYACSNTAVAEEEIYNRKIEAKSDRIHIVYYVNDGTVAMFDQVILPIVPFLEREYGERLYWTFIGVKPNLHGYRYMDNVKYIDHVSLKKFRELLRQGDFSFGIAPLTKSEFNGSKYINKFIEFTTAGIPCIYSDVEPYAGFIENGVNGILCSNTEEAWLDAIRSMTDVNMQKHCVENAREKIRTQFTESKIAKKLLMDIPLLSSYQAPADRKVRGFMRVHIISFFIRLADPFVRAYQRYRQEGLGSVLFWTWSHYILRRR